MIYNFRFDRDHRETVLRLLQNSQVLSQGWGGGTEANLSLDSDRFRQKTVERYGMDTTHIPTNLTKIRNFTDGTLLVTPHLPQNGTVSIHEVDGDYPACYSYVENDETNLNHRIHIRESWGLEGNVSTDTWRLAPWKAKLPWLRYPVLPIEQYESHFREIVNELRNKPEQEFGSSDLERYLQDLSEGLVEETQTRLERIIPSGSGISFEEVCRLLLTSAGYEVEREHQYDGKGGDVDFVLRRSDVSPFEMEETLLFVQVKKHSGETGRGAVQQVLRMMKQEPDANGCVVTLADEFTDDARTLAENNGIALINGPTACRLLIEQVVTGST